MGKETLTPIECPQECDASRPFSDEVGRGRQGTLSREKKCFDLDFEDKG